MNKCRACGSVNIECFFDLGNQPFANDLLNEKIENKKYPLSLSFCKDCSLVQLDYTADPKELFSNYFWVTSTADTTRKYANLFCNKIMQRAGKEINYILEIASNDGTFLKPFKEKGFDVLGVDPAQNIAKMASENGIPTQVDFFGENVARNIVSKKGKPDIVYARNVLPHVANLHDFINGLKVCCSDNALLILEVHYWGKILDELHYDSIYHEHLCYFTLKSLDKLLSSAGLYIFDIEKSPISGGSVVLFLRNTVSEKSDALKQIENCEKDNGYNDFEKIQAFSHMSFKHREALKEIVDNEIKSKKVIVGYGASARSSTMLNFCGINNEQITAIADQNPLKQGKFTPGTNIPIMSPKYALSLRPDTILLLAWNFKDEILKILKDEFNFKGNVIVPLPYPPDIEVIKL